VNARPVYIAALIVYLTAFALLTALQYRMPYAYSNEAVSTSSLGAVQWQRLWHFHIPALSISRFSHLFQIALTAVWLSYGALIAAAARLPQGPSKAGRLSIAVLALTALFFPPTFSADSFLYAGYGRIQLLYHANPYLVGPPLLEGHHDAAVNAFRATPDAPWHFFWREPSIYGPVWTVIEAASALLIRPFGLYGQILFFKLFAAASIFALARTVRTLGANDTAPIPASVAALAIGLNPGLLMEGAGNAHNDIMVAACIAAFFLYSAARRSGAAGLMLGLAIGIKVFPVTLIPWGLAEIRRDGGSGRLKRAALLTAGALLPIVVGYAFYWHGLATFQATMTYLHSTEHASPLPTIAVYLALSAWVYLRKGAGLPAWAILAVWLGIWTQDHKVPWYLCWGMSAALCRLDTVSQRIALIIGTIMLVSALHTYALM
jgi:hypothetical protein